MKISTGLFYAVCGAVSAALCLCSIGSAAELRHDIVFSSGSGFTVKYPRTWTRIDNSVEELSILSGKPRVEGVVIPRGQAEIIVREVHDPMSDGVRKFVETEYHVNVLSDKRLEIPHGDGSACGALEEIHSTFDIAPGATQEDIFYFCRMGTRSFLTLYTYWSADGVNSKRERVAVNIARSLRLAQ
jgi:hypothetical protein